jgi:hypothetical protein
MENFLQEKIIFAYLVTLPYVVESEISFLCSFVQPYFLEILSTIIPPKILF